MAALYWTATSTLGGDYVKDRARLMLLAAVALGLPAGLLGGGCAENNVRRDCGNGRLDPAEACDDGNREDGDGCRHDCVIEPAFSCFGEPSVCETGCGDGLVAGQEQCDDGNLLDLDGCGPGCAVEPGYTCTGVPSVCVTTCGDGVLAAVEDCDDGNQLDGDGCAPDCTVESGWACSGEPSQCAQLCGNDVLDSGEACDGVALNGEDCTSVPGDFTGGQLACSPQCTFDTDGCISAGCGTGIIDTGETCDDGNTVAGDGCTANCQVEPGWACTGEPSQCVNLCGNGVLDADEECDGALLGGATCATVSGHFTGGTLHCTDCLYDTQACTTCGNGQPETGEACDDGNLVAGDGCSPTCTVETLPRLHWATGDPAVWDEMTLTYAGDPHAPQTPIVAACNADQRGYAYVFTATTYHELSLPGHQWVGHGTLASRFPQVPGAELQGAAGVSWPSDSETSVMFVTRDGVSATVHVYYEDNTTGAITWDRSDPLDWSSDPNAPDAMDTKAAFIALSNDNGWTHHDLYALCSATNPSTPTDADVFAYLGVITTADQLYLQDSSYCWLFYEHLATGTFAPFNVSGAPTASDVVATFYSTAHGQRLYVITSQ